MRLKNIGLICSSILIFSSTSFLDTLNNVIQEEKPVPAFIEKNIGNIVNSTLLNSSGSEPSTNYSYLVQQIKQGEKKIPLSVFSNFEKSFDQDLHKSNLIFFNQHPEFVIKIKEDLDDQEVQWNLKNISQRLLYVPETRKEYAKLFENYCSDVIDEILRLTGFNNPYNGIQTLGIGKPEKSQITGIRAFIVNNLAKEYISTYIFSNKDRKEIEIELKGKVWLNEVGSFSSYIKVTEDGSFELTQDTHTIWQNNAKNPYTTLSTPVEETLHISLRAYTENAIKKSINNGNISTISGMEVIVKDWIAVEEALVGGLVHSLMPRILKKYNIFLPDRQAELDLETKSKFEKYQHLRRGIFIVKQGGYKESIDIYREDPDKFRNLLIMMD